MPVVNQIRFLFARIVQRDALDSGHGTDLRELNRVRFRMHCRQRGQGNVEQDREQDGPAQDDTKLAGERHAAILSSGIPPGNCIIQEWPVYI